MAIKVYVEIMPDNTYVCYDDDDIVGYGYTREDAVYEYEMALEKLSESST